MLCEICSDKQHKYTCPNCGVKTCSLPCVKQHKNSSSCDGKRDKTKFVALDSFEDSNLLSDYRFLEETDRKVGNAQRDELSQRRKNPKHLSILTRNARKRGITLKLLPYPLTKRVKNTTYFNFRSQQFQWLIEWIFTEGGLTLSRKVHENTTLKQALLFYIHPRLSEPVTRHKLQHYVQTVSVSEPEAADLPISTSEPQAEDLSLSVSEPQAEDLSISTSEPQTEDLSISTPEPQTEDLSISTSEPQAEDLSISTSEPQTEDLSFSTSEPKPDNIDDAMITDPTKSDANVEGDETENIGERDLGVHCDSSGDQAVDAPVDEPSGGTSMCTEETGPTQSADVTKRAEPWSAVDISKGVTIEDIAVFMKRQDLPANIESYYRLELDASLAENLKDKTIVEYPTFYVAPRKHWYRFTVTDDTA